MPDNAKVLHWPKLPKRWGKTFAQRKAERIAARAAEQRAQIYAPKE